MAPTLAIASNGINEFARALLPTALAKRCRTATPEQAPGGAHQGLDALDWALVLDSQSHVKP
jgi:hypothetical protein